MKSLLIIGSNHDELCIHLKKAAVRKNINPVILKPENFFDKLNIEFCLDGNVIQSKLKSGKKKIDLINLIALFPRVTNLIRNSYLDSGKDSIYKANEWNSFYKGLLHSFNIPVVNLLSPEYWNKQALTPMDLFMYSGKIDLIIPGFITSNIFDELKDFFLACCKKVLYSPLTLTSANYPIENDEEFMKLSSLLKFMQVTLFEVPAGIYYKIFVTNNRTFVVNVKGNESKVMPENILNDCIFLSKKFNLSLAEFAIIVNRNKFYLTGVNLISDFSGCSEQIIMKIINGIFKSIKNKI